MANKGEPLHTRIIDGRITEAVCSLCNERLELGNEVGSSKEQDMKVRAAFGIHMNAKHRREDASQAAARIVKEATEDR